VNLDRLLRIEQLARVTLERRLVDGQAVELGHGLMPDSHSDVLARFRLRRERARKWVEVSHAFESRKQKGLR
jgi:hypothetical protein